MGSPPPPHARVEVRGCPRLLVLTDRRQAVRLGLLATVAAAVAGGARTVVLREKDLRRAEREELGSAIVEQLAPVDGTLFLAGPDAELAKRIGAGGLHLASADPLPAPGSGLVIGRSCHTLGEVRAAAVEGIEYVTASPIFSTPSKPGYGPPLAAAGLAELAGATALPVVALGGVTPTGVATCMAAGAAGVAVMGAVMGAADPGAATADLLASLAITPADPGSRQR